MKSTAISKLWPVDNT